MNTMKTEPFNKLMHFVVGKILYVAKIIRKNFKLIFILFINYYN